MGSRLYVADNSGALEVMCIKPQGGTGKKDARLGDILTVSVKSIKKTASRDKNAKVKVGMVFKAVLVWEPEIKRDDGSVIRFSRSAVVLLDRKDNALIGTRVSHTMPRELRESFPKILSLASEVL